MRLGEKPIWIGQLGMKQALRECFRVLKPSQLDIFVLPRHK